MAARGIALAVGCALAVSACGSTVQVSRSVSTLSDGTGGSVPTTGASDLGSGGALPTSGAVPGSTGGTSGSQPGGPGGRVEGTTGVDIPQGATGASPGATSVPGVTATQVRVGIAYLANGNEAARTAGVNLDRGNERQDWDAVVAEVNAHGGVAGRRLVPVYFAYDAQSTQTIATQEQTACTRFTQDQRVFAVVTAGSETFEACLHRAGVLHTTPGSYVGPDRDFLRRYPTYFTQRPSQDRMQSDLVTALVRQSYFSGWDTLRGAPAGTPAKVGIVAVDQPAITRTVDRVLLPALRRAGHPVDSGSVYRVPNTPSAQESGPAAAAVQNATLHLHQSGVTHVIVLDTNGTATLLFAQQSSNQGYYPRLGVTSASGIQQLYDLHAVTAKQLAGASGLGWTPTLDLPVGQSDRYLSSAVKTCLDVMKRRTGQTFTSATAAGVALISCDAVFTFATVLQHAGRALTVATAVRAYESIGRALVSASVGRLFFSATHHDGLEVAYDMAWDSGCSCTRYRDAGHRMP